MSSLLVLRIAGFCMLLLTALLAQISWQLTPETAVDSQPILQAVYLLGAMFCVYLVGVRMVRRIADELSVLRTVVVYSVLLRLTLLFSMPILEIDLYRYMWDGAVCTQGVSPYAYSPQQVLLADGIRRGDTSLDKLVVLEGSSEALASIIRRIHFPELTTIYPPVSQFVFAATAWLVPLDAPELVRVLAMKFVLIAFDLATLAIVVGLLRLCGKPTTLAIVYAWCPLVLKEIANSGHLDSIAVFFSTTFMYWVCRSLHQAQVSSAVVLPKVKAWGQLLLASLFLALGVGAKIYPVILLGPAFVVIWRRGKVAYAICLTLLGALLGLACLLPMFLNVRHSASDVATSAVTSSEIVDAVTIDLLAPPVEDVGNGLAAFASHWEINDFLFSIILDTVRPNSATPQGREAWFAFTPNRWREALIGQISDWANVPPSQVSIWLAKGIALVCWGAISLVVMARLTRIRAEGLQNPNESSAEKACALYVEASFFVVAWFWMLSPTQNSWYWTWTMPMLAVVRNRVWILVSGFALVYYLRFWFASVESWGPLLGTSYAGTAFFDKIVVWFEFLPVLIAVFLGRFVKWNR